MKPLLSPWLDHLQRAHPIHHLRGKKKTNIAILGGGISGVTTAYYLLRNTSYSISLLEANRIASGATGHNAGHLVSYFERHFASLAKEYGLLMTADAQNAIDSCWEKLNDIYDETHIKTPFDVFTGYAGCQDTNDVLTYLEDNFCRKKAHLSPLPFVISNSSFISKHIPKKYNDLYSLESQKKVLSLLQTENEHFIAAISDKKGVLNSAVFCEEMIGYLTEKFPGRFSLFEKTPVSKIVLHKNHVQLVHATSCMLAEKVILCTNGYKNFTIQNLSGPDIHNKFQNMIEGLIGFMGAYIDTHIQNPIAINYLPLHEQNSIALNASSYFYLTRRIITMKKKKACLIAVGGPEEILSKNNVYDHRKSYPLFAQKEIEKFFHSTYAPAPKGKIRYSYLWHGLMGYTPTGLRLVGPEPLNTRLLYNLGCNGIGILSAIHGGQKIASILSNQPQAPSLFDIPL